MRHNSEAHKGSLANQWLKRGIFLNLKLKEKIEEALAAVLPITAIVLILSIVLVPLDISVVVMFFAGAFMLIIGMGMFQLGAEMSMSPIGEGMGASLGKSRSKGLVAAVCFAMGVIITIAEPDLQILSKQVPAIPDNVLVITVAIGVGICLCIAVLRTILHINLSLLLSIFYAAVILLSFFVPREFLALAFDSGGVTTGPITVPFIMALGVGLSAVRGDKDASSDSFGLVAISGIGPIIAVMLLGYCYSPKDAIYVPAEIAEVSTMRDVLYAFAVQLPVYAKEVLISVLPIAMVFVLFQLITKRYQKRQIKCIAVGFIYTYIGLVLFLCGVNAGFAPVGNMLGKELAGSEQKWLLIPIGMLIGYFIVKAEPAIQILNHQVQSVTKGTISAKTMNICLSVGVSVSIGLAVLKILTHIPMQWIIIPGYAAALFLSRFVPQIFVGIAFDSGGVASGPMTSTFLLPLCIGACEAVRGNIMTDAFGVVALVALTPLIAVQLMGLQYKRKEDKQARLLKSDSAIPDDADMIIEIMEE